MWSKQSYSNFKAIIDLYLERHFLLYNSLGRKSLLKTRKKEIVVSGNLRRAYERGSLVDLAVGWSLLRSTGGSRRCQVCGVSFLLSQERDENRAATRVIAELSRLE